MGPASGEHGAVIDCLGQVAWHFTKFAMFQLAVPTWHCQLEPVSTECALHETMKRSDGGQMAGAIKWLINV